MTNFIDKLTYIHLEHGKVLMTLTRGHDTWLSPGGKREAGETDHAALIREIQEELSVDLVPESLRFYGVFEAQAHGKPDGTIVRLTCYTGDFTGTLKANSEIAEFGFFNYAQKDLTSTGGRLIFDDLHAKGLLK